MLGSEFFDLSLIIIDDKENKAIITDSIACKDPSFNQLSWTYLNQRGIAECYT